MNGKLIIFLVVVVVIIAAIFLMPNQADRQPPVEAFAPEETQQRMNPESAAPPEGMPAPPIDSLHVAVQDSNGAEVAHVTLVPDQPHPLPGTEYALRLTDFYTHLVLHDNQPVNMSPHPENVAARIEILKDGTVVDYTWTFERVPFFRMGNMGGHAQSMNTGLAFALERYHGLDAPPTSTNP